MLDLNRLIGLIYHSSSPVVFKAIKDGLAEVTVSFDDDDVVVVQGDYCQGAGEATAYVANSLRLVNEADFANMTKAVVKAIGEAEINSPKVVFIISDCLSDEMDHTFDKMQRLNQVYDYESALYFLQINKHSTCRHTKSQCIVVDDVEAMVEEVQQILEELDGSGVTEEPETDE